MDVGSGFPSVLGLGSLGHALTWLWVRSAVLLEFSIQVSRCRFRSGGGVHGPSLGQYPFIKPYLGFQKPTVLRVVPSN